MSEPSKLSALDELRSKYKMNATSLDSELIKFFDTATPEYKLLIGQMGSMEGLKKIFMMRMAELQADICNIESLEPSEITMLYLRIRLELCFLQDVINFFANAGEWYKTQAVAGAAG